MDDLEKLYTVEEIATMTSLTTRTIRNYIKDGRLKGRKIGGNWRFTKDEVIELFNGNSFAKDLSNEVTTQVLNFVHGKSDSQVCTIINLPCESTTEGKQHYKKLVQIINNHEIHGPCKFNYQYLQSEKIAQFTLFGTPEFIKKTLEQL